MNPAKKETPKYQNKSQRNKNVISPAMEIFRDKKILCERPENMDRDVYCLLRKMQSESLKSLFHKGKSPSRKLMGLLPIKQPTIRITAPTRKITTPRKTN